MVLWFNDPAATATSVCGGKGASLSRMASGGLPVPPGFVVCAPAFQLRSEAAIDAIDAIDGLDGNNSKSLACASERLRGTILSQPLPCEVEKAIVQAYGELGVNTPVAVRSSAVSEDGESASSAGQQETFLNVRGADAVIRCVRECWASFFTPRAMFYRIQKGSVTDTRMAVVVQEMVLAEKSGVLFTVDPVRKVREHMVIEAVFGLGEGIVSGLITPDHYVIQRSDGSLVREFIAPQFTKIVLDDGAEGTAEVELSEEEGAARVLSDAQLNRLHETGLRLERLFGAPQDIEWSIRGDDLFLLQSRPITNL